MNSVRTRYLIQKALRWLWLAVLVGGGLITILSLYNKGRTDTETADKISDGSTGGVTTEPKAADEPAEE